MVELTIDGKKVQVEKNANILQAALTNGIYIPHFCYDRRLKRFGGCRMCLVELDGRRRPVAACSTPVKQGMTIVTDTPRIRKARQTILELLLIYHPLECPICVKAGECSLQDLVFKYGKPETRFNRTRSHAQPDVRGPLIELEANLCILCGKCIRICAEHQGCGALGFIGRGFHTIVQPAFGEVLKCDYCGQCVDICPTGAIANKTFKYNCRAWYLEEKDTVCPFCSVGCTATLGVMEGKIMRSRGREGKGLTDGNLCGRGRFGFDYIYSENRLSKPLIRKDGELTQATWDQALTLISETFFKIVKNKGAHAIGAIGSGRCTNEDNYALQKLMRNVIGTGNIDTLDCFGYGRAIEAFHRAFGLSSNPASLGAPLEKDFILIIESDISSSHPVYGLNILQAKRQGAELVVIDCRQTKLTWHSSEHLYLKQPALSVCLLNGMMKAIIEHGLFNREQVENIPGFSELVSMLNDYGTAKVAELTGAPEKSIVESAMKIAKAKNPLVALTMNVSENNKSLNLALAAANLTLLLGQPPESLVIPAPYCNSMGALTLNVKPDQGFLDARAMLYETGVLSALYIMGQDPVASLPDGKRVVNALKSIDFLVVQDIALTETAQLAHVVLPALSWAEKEGSFLNMSGIKQKLTKIVSSKTQALPDWQILNNLGFLMGVDLGFKNLRAVEREVDERLACQEKREVKNAFNPTPYLTQTITSEDFPYILVLRDSLQHSGTMSARSKSLDLVLSEAIIEINANDATKADLKEGAYVKVISKKGEVFIKAAISNHIPRGVVFTNPHFPHAKINTLTSLPENDDTALCAVRIEKV
jgi:NADH-quinone oxidoreductase chain G